MYIIISCQCPHNWLINAYRYIMQNISNLRLQPPHVPVCWVQCIILYFSWFWIYTKVCNRTYHNFVFKDMKRRLLKWSWWYQYDTIISSNSWTKKHQYSLSVPVLNLESVVGHWIHFDIMRHMLFPRSDSAIMIVLSIVYLIIVVWFKGENTNTIVHYHYSGCLFDI